MSKIRHYKQLHHKFDKRCVGQLDGGFSCYVCFGTRDRYVQGSAPNGNRYVDAECELAPTLAVEKDGIWIVWNPGWGVDCHWPADNCPTYLRDGSDNHCEYVGGKCRSDGSSLADREQFWPAFTGGGVDAVFQKLAEWWRPTEETT